MRANSFPTEPASAMAAGGQGSRFWIRAIGVALAALLTGWAAPGLAQTDYVFDLVRGEFEVIGPFGGVTIIETSGPATVRVTFETTPGAAQDDDVPSDGLDEVQTELVSMSLTGDTVNYGVVPVTLWSGAPSLGEIEEQVDGTIADLDLFNQNLAGPQTFVAGNTITAGGDFSFFPDLVVLDDAQIVLHAGNVVVMKHGVQVDQNGNLTVIVDSVSNGVLDLPPFGTGDADSFFDLYIETTINFLGVWVLHNELPARIETVITEWPPRTNEVYVGTFDPPLPLLQPNGEQFGLSALVRVELELRPTGD